MNKPIKLTFLLLLACLVMVPAKAQKTPEWQSQYAVGLNKLAPHTYVWPYADAADVKKGDYEQSPYYLSLNGKWKFHWVKNPDLRPKDFYKPSFYTGGWADINVPGNWERQGYGTAIYVNETYEFDDKMFNFKKNPPLVPSEENEVGSYRRTFTVPSGWKDRRVVLCCEGVTSFYYVWVNGHFLGYNQGSKTAAEWDITDKLEEGENTVALEVYRWSSGSYLECQDMWRLSGIERDVYLYSTPKQYIADYKVNATLEKERYKDGIFGLDVTVEGPANGAVSITYTLNDAAGTAPERREALECRAPQSLYARVGTEKCGRTGDGSYWLRSGFPYFGDQGRTFLHQWCSGAGERSEPSRTFTTGTYRKQRTDGAGYPIDEAAQYQYRA